MKHRFQQVTNEELLRGSIADACASNRRLPELPGSKQPMLTH